ncbi:hypothetical protein Pst134EA_013520 [Puccinia striiformis f. sp. tritici]|uniref:hypothetical protein n=1 Tax=Puccinia striiformis f. sp. tritici TaxID=168172 RepID=UPI002007AE61|nr:hypothetical protein Pst134EA_013520 [Puccinia striiformis f. sp. tritici]KAH9465637.1 hypothetical protein Pst134EA_013520 [Puccinia striiformis f. sp. tritici]
MRAVIQRVTSASVTGTAPSHSLILQKLKLDIVNQNQISRIGKGLCVLVGIGTDDTIKEMNYIINKILSIRLFPSSKDIGEENDSIEREDQVQKEWKQSIRDINGEILIVSQFTLLAKTKKGNKPDFHKAMKTESSKTIYEELIRSIKMSYSEDLIKEGQFGAMMQVEICNDGPVTMIIDTTVDSQ